MANNWKYWIMGLISILIVSVAFQKGRFGSVSGNKCASDGNRKSTKVINRYLKIQEDLKNLTNIQKTQRASSSSEFLNLLKDFTDKNKYPDEPVFELKSLFKRWFEFAPDQALDEALAIRNLGLRQICLVEGISAFASDPDRLLEIYDTQFDSAKEQKKFAMALFEIIGSKDPWNAIALLRDQRFQGYQKDGIKSIFSSYAKGEKSTFTSLMSVLENLNKSDLNQALETVLVSGGIRPSLSQYLEIVRLGADERVVGSAFASASEQMLANEDVEEYLIAIDNIPIPEASKRDVIKACLEKLEREHSLTESVTILQNSPLGKDQKTIAVVLTTKWSIAEGKMFASSLEDSNPEKGAALRFVADMAVRKDVNDAALWISTLPPGNFRDEALQPLLTYLRKHNENESLDRWSKLLSGSK